MDSSSPRLAKYPSAYLNRVLTTGYLNQFKDKKANDLFEPGHDLDGISGATYTVNGIALAVRKGAWQTGKNELDIQVPAAGQLTLGWQELGLVILYGLVFLTISRRYHKLRPWILAGSVIILSFFLNASLSLADLTSLLSGNWPSPLEHPFWYILTLGVPTLTLLWGRNFYCTWNCPYSVPQFIEETGIIGKCDSCKGLRDKGGNPVCVDSCPMRCLAFGDLDEPETKHGFDLVQDLPILPSSTLINPSLLVKPKKYAFDPTYVEKKI